MAQYNPFQTSLGLVQSPWPFQMLQNPSPLPFQFGPQQIWNNQVAPIKNDSNNKPEIEKKEKPYKKKEKNDDSHKESTELFDQESMIYIHKSADDSKEVLYSKVIICYFKI